jgi:uncharacterized protein with PhoU and TrkA domain
MFGVLGIDITLRRVEECDDKLMGRCRLRARRRVDVVALIRENWRYESNSHMLIMTCDTLGVVGMYMCQLFNMATLLLLF